MPIGKTERKITNWQRHRGALCSGRLAVFACFLAVENLSAYCEGLLRGERAALFRSVLLCLIVLCKPFVKWLSLTARVFRLRTSACDRQRKRR